MATYDEFRLHLTPDEAAPGTWKVQLVACPISALVGGKGSVTPVLTKEQLRRIRSPHNWPSLGELRAIGESVWNSIMNHQVEAAFHSCVMFSKQQGRRLRLVLAIDGEPTRPQPGDRAGLAELPFEALYNDDFVATNLDTPVSRSLSLSPDAKPHEVVLPLRVLVVIAAPTDKPPANMQAEKRAILDALQPLIDQRGVEVEFCEGATRKRLNESLEKPYDIIHFIAHGAFDTVGNDPTPVAYICLEDEATRESDPINAHTLRMMLANMSIRLVVITACSSSTPNPVQEPYEPRAFDGIAQRLMSGLSGVTAVVAMQFDLESKAAVHFSYSFYRNLISPEKTLDEVVTYARKYIALMTDAGHRAWVTPTVYWRCDGGKVFEYKKITAPAPLDEETLRKLRAIDFELEFYYRQVSKHFARPAGEQQMLAPLFEEMKGAIMQLQEQRGRLLGETLRLWGDAVRPGGEINCRVTIRLRGDAAVGLLQFRVLYPADKLTYVSSAAGANAGGTKPAVSDDGAGELEVLLADASGDVRWPAGEYEIGFLRFRLKADAPEGLIDLRVRRASVARDGLVTPYEPLDAVIFVTE